ncbi:deoxycytidylate deaminase [Thermodesulfitimonas autotrophica]|uniref:dCMP deaminase n=1 Tax=Thermodesulfitimonas autotrophica TaxID=1894989 RepID=A0A3N5AEG6_9THEO|nr:cytidine/deoxycytidylate deaminase family protein [Thermodesulfitimonas autotrophica]RPF42963.1 dCMP deaminase [Thermodesulfitimonas autotrophica]
MRPDWDLYFMTIARVVATRSTCLRRQVGAVLVKDNRILATGYNGAPSGLRHCLDTGCLREEQGIRAGERHELCRGLHAEQNAILQAAVHGTSIAGATVYTTHHPCVLCAKMLVQAGVKRIVFGGDYPDELAQRILSEAGVKVERFAGEIDFPGRGNGGDG